jgi:hypothetical protein
MFDRKSRYDAIEDATLSVTGSDGQPRTVAYKRRRFVPPSADMTVLVEHACVQGERLDNITARYVTDPTQFWRVCDANEVMRPDELEQVGRRIRIAMSNP